MEKYVFIKRIEELKPVLKGRWSSVARRAGVDDHTVRNYAKGMATDEDLRVKILDACEAELKDLKELIDEVY